MPRDCSGSQRALFAGPDGRDATGRQLEAPRGDVEGHREGVPRSQPDHLSETCALQDEMR